MHTIIPNLKLFNLFDFFNFQMQTKKFSHRNFPELSRTNARNYCRNPDGDNGGPWCFVDTENFNAVRKEYCDIPLLNDRECLVYTRAANSYSTITKMDYSLRNITIYLKLWNPSLSQKVHYFSRKL